MQRIYAIYGRVHQTITALMKPEPAVFGLGRWGSTIPERKRYQLWFHDACSQDNCYLRWTPPNRTQEVIEAKKN